MRDKVRDQMRDQMPDQIRGQVGERGHGHRAERLAAEIQRAMQALLARGLNDPRIRGLITVTGVDVSDDRREAVVRVSVLPEEHQGLTMHGLHAATGRLRRQAMDRVRSRTFPRIRFEADAAYKNELGILAAIAKASGELPPESGADADQDGRAEETAGEGGVADGTAVRGGAAEDTPQRDANDGPTGSPEGGPEEEERV